MEVSQRRTGLYFEFIDLLLIGVLCHESGMTQIGTKLIGHDHQDRAFHCLVRMERNLLKIR